MSVIKRFFPKKIEPIPPIYFPCNDVNNDVKNDVNNDLGGTGWKSLINCERKCCHFRQEVKFGEYRILCSASSDISKDTGIVPDMGIYMDSSWKKQTDGILMSPGINDFLYEGKSIPSIIVDWPDRDIPEESILKTIVSYAVDKVKNGVLLDIGCVGGHGRTGTLLALIMANLSDMSAEDIISWIRKNYCHEAIESYKQESAIYRAKGAKIPPKHKTLHVSKFTKDKISELENMPTIKRLASLSGGKTYAGFTCIICEKEFPQDSPIYRDSSFSWEQCEECFKNDLSKLSVSELAELNKEKENNKNKSNPNIYYYPALSLSDKEIFAQTVGYESLADLEFISSINKSNQEGGEQVGH